MRIIPLDWPRDALSDAAFAALARLRAAGFDAAIVGGAVRDRLAGHIPADIDIVTTARPEQAIRLFPSAKQVGAAFGVLLVEENGRHFEVASARLERNYLDGRHPEEVAYADDLAVDVARRDFTVNALLYDPERRAVIDYVGGVGDFNRGLLRTVGDPGTRFREDYLRLLRAVRFAARLRFEVAPETRSALAELAGLTALVAKERLGEELTMMLTGRNPEYAFRLLQDTGILRHILPEVAAMDGVEQPAQYHPEGDVFEHTMLMLRHAVAPSPELAWGILLHDAGKPPAFQRDEEGVPHFYHHEIHSALLAREILGRLRFSNERIERVVHLAGNHMLFGLVSREAKIRRIMGGRDFADELELNRLDAVSGGKISEQFIRLLDRRIADADRVELPPPAVTGRDLIAAGLTPGPRFKEWLDALYDLQLEGRLGDPAAAIRRVAGSAAGTP